MGKLYLMGGTDSDLLVDAKREIHKSVMNNPLHNLVFYLWPEIVKELAEPRSQKEQYQMGLALAERAQESNECVYVFTHSNHVLNGIRVAIKTKVIDHLNVEFRLVEEDKVTILQLNEAGRPNSWPPGFFDHVDEELHLLL